MRERPARRNAGISCGGRALFRLRTWADILIHTEQIVRVVFVFHCYQALVARAVSGLNAVGFIIGQEIHVHTACRIRRGLAEESARPVGAFPVFGRCLPASVNVAYVDGIPMARAGGATLIGMRRHRRLRHGLHFFRAPAAWHCATRAPCTWTAGRRARALCRHRRSRAAGSPPAVGATRAGRAVQAAWISV